MHVYIYAGLLFRFILTNVYYKSFVYILVCMYVLSDTLALYKTLLHYTRNM